MSCLFFFAVVLILGMVGWEIIEVGLEKEIKSLSLEKERNYFVLKNIDNNRQC
jgi:hypothetical protein